MTFYGFAVTFRHNLNEVGTYQFFFANQMFWDKKFPRDSNEYTVLKKYITESYKAGLIEGFENIWNAYQKSKEFHERKIVNQN